jgi:predicted phage tail protein
VTETGGRENLPHDSSPAKTKSPLELAGSTSSLEFRDEHFELGATYRYTVRSVAQFGTDLVESADSESAILAARDVFPPAAPINLEATVIPATGQSPPHVELSWAISPEGDLAGYSVYRSDSADTPGERISTEILPSPTFRDISVVPGKRYFYRVSALDRAGNESPKSAAVQVDLP